MARWRPRLRRGAAARAPLLACLMFLIAGPPGLLPPALVHAVPLNQKSTAPNQPPVLTAPASINVTEDAEARVAVGVSDPDVDADFDGMLKLTLQAHNGTVILPTTVGLSFLVGAGGTPGAAGHSLVSFVASQAHAQGVEQSKVDQS